MLYVRKFFSRAQQGYSYKIAEYLEAYKLDTFYLIQQFNQETNFFC